MLKSLEDLIAEAKTIAVLTGAGVSTESGIPDFKQNDETWPYPEPRHELISVPYFERNPVRFWKIYREVFSSKFNADPNPVHYWLAELEKEHEVTIITQNVEGLHQKAGSTNVIEVHGTNSVAVCRRGCGPVPMDSLADIELPRCPNCNKPLKPGVSLFMDGIHGMGEARDAARSSDLFIVMGTSLAVGPINEIPYFASAYPGKPVLWINREEPPESHAFVFTHRWLGEFRDFPKNGLMLPGESFYDAGFLLSDPPRFRTVKKSRRYPTFLR